MKQLKHTGMTLIELIVAIAILSIIILGVGYIFTQTSSAVNLTESAIEVDSTFRAGSIVIREDFRNMTKDGFLCVAEGSASTAPMVMFTAADKYTSVYTGGTANSAIITLMPTINSRDGFGHIYSGQILGRFAHILTGTVVGGNPDTLSSLIAGSGCISNRDYLNTTSEDIRSLSVAQVDANFCREAYYGAPCPLNCAPSIVTGKLVGAVYEPGVNDLWPYLMGGCVNMDVYVFVYDSTAKNWVWKSPHYMTSTPPGLTVASVGGGPSCSYALWTWRDKTNWPKAVKIILTLQGRPDPKIQINRGRGDWDPNRAYLPGDLVRDTQDSTSWVCNVIRPIGSALKPPLDREANPGSWTQVPLSSYELILHVP